MFFRII